MRKNQGLSPDRKELIARAVENSQSETSDPPPDESKLATARNLREDLRFYSAPSGTYYLCNISAAAEQRDGTDEAQEAPTHTALFGKKKCERQRLIAFLDAMALASSAVFAKNTVTERNRAAKEVSARNERKCRGLGRFLPLRLEEANNQEIDE